MKAKDIEVGGHYAVEKHSGYTVRGYVVAVGNVTRRVYSNNRWDFNGHRSTTVMASFVQVDPETGLAGAGRTVEHVVLAKVKRTWDEHVRIDAGIRERAARFDAGMNDLEARLQELADVKVYIRRTTNGTHYAGTATIRAEDVRKIVEALEAARAGK